MMVKVGRRISLLLLIAIALSAIGCTDDQVTKMAKASDDLAASISAAISLKRELAKEGKLTQAQELELTKGLFAVNEAAIVLNNKIKATKNLNGDAKGALVKDFSDVTEALSRINGVYGTDTATQQKVQSAIGAIGAALTVVQGFIQ